MAINYYSVLNDLEANNWTLLSTEYKNLKTPLTMRCPNGHDIEDTYEHWRKYKICEACRAGNPYKVQSDRVPEKNDTIFRILALDAATITTGYSIYDNGELVHYGTFQVKNEIDTTERINIVKRWLIAAVEEWQPDFVGIEHIQLQKFGANNQVEMYRVLANLQGVLIDTLFELSIPYDLVYSSTWRKYVGVEGNERENKKRAAQEKVLLWYSMKVNQDEADAICIGKYFISNYNKKSIGTWGEKI